MARLTIDRIRCDGSGMCAELLPEFIELDDWGFPIVRPGTIPPEMLRLAQRAVDVCPLLALAVIDEPRAVRSIGRSVA